MELISVSYLTVYADNTDIPRQELHSAVSWSGEIWSAVDPSVSD